MSFVHLHTHSEYSLLDGQGRIKKLVAEAKRLGQPALALTDHGVMHGAIEFFRACQDAAIKPIIGVESYQTVWGRPMGGRDPDFDRENYHLLLLAKNMTGYRNLLKIASHSQLNGYYYRPRVDHEFLQKHAEGIIATTGCMGAEVPQLLSQGKEREAYERLGWYVETFGKENFFVELQEHSIEELRPINKVLVPWADQFGIQLLATNDVHYVREEDGDPHDVLLCVQTGALVNDEKRMRLSDRSYFLKSRAQMEATFRPFIDLPAGAFDNSLLIAEMCDVDLEDKNYHLPDIDIPAGFTYETYLRKLTEEGLERLYGDNAHNSDVQERKEHELKIIHQMGFDVYFLIVADLCHYAQSRGIWWNVRGSGAGSLVAYCTGITGIDPLKNNLIFERFLNPARVSMPDFDLDFPDDQREEMIRYTVEKYGDDQVAQIATMNRMKARAAIRDVGRAKGIELPKVDRIAKLIPAIPGKPVTIQDVLTEGHEFYNPELVDLVKTEPWVQDLVETSMKLEGVARNSGIHAAAVIVADRDLTHYTPLMRASKGSITNAVTQYEFPILESIGLLKVDFLGLSTLTVMREVTRLVHERHGRELTLANIPFEGEAAVEAFKLLSSGEVSGVFQVEGQGMRRVLTEMKPTAFEHIIAMISLYRPGPIEYIPQFIRRMHGEEEVAFKHPKLESILSETYGICVYQEQIIQILSQLAGYAPGDADLVRRAVSKKKASDIEKHKKSFVAGCKNNGIKPEIAEAIYGDIEFFARYGFNKCLSGDTEVLDATSGRLVRVEDLYHGKAQLAETITCEVDTLRLKAGRVAAVHDNGIKPVYRLTTALGRTIEATANHPFYTFDGWRLLGELQPGDQLAVPRRLPVEGKTKWPVAQLHELARLVIANEFDELPSAVFTLTNEQVRELLVFILGDLESDNREPCLLLPATASPRLTHQLQHLLLRLGIICGLTRQTRPSLKARGYMNRKTVEAAWQDSPVHGTLVANQAALAPDGPADNDIYWDRIDRIEYMGEKQTYDLEVPGTHNFIANDILVHNSHAADYAVICVQTAYLKAHYPVEYMAALLLVERDKTEKVTNFINESRRMGIEVLPPDVNFSGLDFEIQKRPADAPVAAHRDPTIGYPFPVPPGSAIRFGMAATKNVGENPVQVILKARSEGGPFQSIEDFCNRVDLRQVGKRPLECLVKVGAFDRFGKRSQLLAVLDQMVEKSAQVHNDRASGQLSIFDLFGEGGAHEVTSIPLPELDEVKGKERLQWEKELLGVYANSHPLQQMSVDVRRVATCSCGEFDEQYHDKNVTLAGMIVDVRTINTKKGDQMAFVKIEDPHGQCEVVVFPRTYAEVKEKLIADTIYLFKGKAQTREGQTSLLLDSLQNFVDVAIALDDKASSYQKPLLADTPTFNGMALKETSDFFANGNHQASNGEEEESDSAPFMDEDDDADDDNGDVVLQTPSPLMVTVAAPVVTTPPPPPKTPNGHAPTVDDINVAFDLAMDAATDVRMAPPPLRTLPQPPVGPTLTARSDEASNPLVASANSSQPEAESSPPPAQRPTPVPSPATARREDNADQPMQQSAPASPLRTAEHRVPESKQNGNGRAASGRQLHITFRRIGDLERDKYRLKEIYDHVRDPRGRDQFFIRIEYNGQAHQLAFPNDACSITERLLQELRKRFRVDVVVKDV
jgi:DNA-directed DNA polymerase III PolC